MTPVNELSWVKNEDLHSWATSFFFAKFLAKPASSKCRGRNPTLFCQFPSWGSIHHLFFPSSQETYIFHIPSRVAFCAVPSSGGFAEKEQVGEEGIRNYQKCVTFSYLPLFCLQLPPDAFCPDLAALWISAPATQRRAKSETPGDLLLGITLTE